MRRAEREVRSFKELLGILDGCEVLRLGLYDKAEKEFPYIVPVNFAYAVQGEQVRFYFHGASAGRKYELMTENGVCSFEMESGSQVAVEREKRNITTYYGSVMGKGRLRRLTGEEAVAALQRLVDRYEVSRGLNWARDCLPHTAVWELAADALTAKRNKG